MPITHKQLLYRDGFIVFKNLFTENEVAKFRNAVIGSILNSNQIANPSDLDNFKFLGNTQGDFVIPPFN